MESVPIWEKELLTLEEAAAVFGIGVNRLRDYTDQSKCSAVLWVGSKRMIKRRKLAEALDREVSI